MIVATVTICEVVAVFFPWTGGSGVESGELDAAGLMAIGFCMSVSLTASALGLEHLLCGGSKETTMLRRRVRL